MRRRRSGRFKQWITVGVLAAAGLGYAGFRAWRGDGPVQDPRFLQFTASPDHSTVGENGLPLVQSYVLELYRPGASAPVERIDLGKPSPSAGGVIQIDLSTIRKPPIAPGTTYEAAITAVGPYGKSGSNRSERFTLTGR